MVDIADDNGLQFENNINVITDDANDRFFDSIGKLAGTSQRQQSSKTPDSEPASVPSPSPSAALPSSATVPAAPGPPLGSTRKLRSAASARRPVPSLLENGAPQWFRTSSGLSQARALRQLALTTDYAARQESAMLMQQLSDYIGVVGIDRVIPPTTISVPNKFADALNSPRSEEWRAAASKEYRSLIDHKIFGLVAFEDVPPDQNIIGSRWVFKVKSDERFKGRIVATGWSQRHGVDCASTFAPVCRIESQRLQLATAAANE